MDEKLLHCKVCKFVKPESHFYRQVLSRCKECHKKAVRANRAEKIDYYLAYDRERAKLPHRLELAKRVFQECNAKFPDRRKARVIVGNAVRDGAIQRQPCWVCGGKAEAHHPDYSRPLDVVWLCSKHHKEAHGAAKSEEIAA